MFFICYIYYTVGKSPYFCARQQKKTARKKLVKRTATLEHVNRLNQTFFEPFQKNTKALYMYLKRCGSKKCATNNK